MKSKSKKRQLSDKFMKHLQSLPKMDRREPRRKPARNVLFDTEETMRVLLNATNDSVILTDKSGTALALNEITAKRLGKRISEILGSSIYRFLPPDVTKSRKIHVDEVIRTGKSKHFEDERQGILFDNDIYPILDADGNVVKLAIYARDITKHKRAEEEIKNTLSLLNATLDSTADGILVVDRKERIVSFNQKFVQMWGIPEAIITTRDDNQALAFVLDQLKNPHGFIAKVRELYHQPEVESFDIFEFKDGRIFERYSQPQWIDKEIVGRVWSFRDVTERRLAEEALLTEKYFSDTVIDSLPGAFYVIDKNGNFIRWNKNQLKVIEYTEEEIHKINAFITTAEEDRDRVRQKIEEVLEKGYAVMEATVLTKSGQKTPYLLTGTRAVIGDQVYILGMGIDITERKQAEEALHQANEMLRAMLEAAPVAIFDLDTEGLVQNIWNPAAERLLGWSRQEALGRFLPSVPEEGREEFREFRERMRSGKSMVGVDVRRQRKDGSPIDYSIYAAPLYDIHGQVKGNIAVLVDMTERKQVEEALKERQETISAIIETSQDWIWAIDRHGVHTYSNPAIEKILGYRTGEIVGSVSLDLMHEDDKKMVEPILQECEEKRCGWNNLLLRWRHKNGTYRYLESNAVPILNSKGDLIGFRGVDRDITERKQAEEALRQSEERYRSILEEIEDGYFEVDLAGHSTFINDSLCKIHGYPRKELLGVDYRQFVDKENAKKMFEAFNRIHRTGEPYKVFDYELIRKDGTKRQVEVSASLKKDSSGNPIGFRGITRDVTERKQAEELLQKEREISLSILENAPYGVALIDKDGKYIYINPEFTNITGYTLQDIPTGKDWFRKAFPDPKDRERVIQVWKEDRSKANMMIREFSINCKDGKIREIEIRSTFLRDGRVVIVLHDITEQKRAEEESEALREQLRQSQKMEAIGRLAGGIAHDFNNLLTIIKGYSQLSLIELKEDSPLKENIEHIHTATDRAADLVRQLLAFSRRQILEMKVLDLNTTLANLHNMLRRLIGEDIELTTVLAEDLGRVKTDLGWIEQAIMNLVVNARDAMPSGGKLTIETGNADLDEANVGGHVGVKPGRYVMLSVSDTGVGMTPEVRERLFEPFFSTKEKDKGTGLGLSTVYGIVKQSGGDIWVYSEPGKGATFKIYLPRVDEPLEEQREKVLGDELLRGSETILLVEDEEGVRKLALRVLERQGYKVLAARDGDEALLVCEQHKDPIHLMLTDVVMPGMNGHELAKRLEPFHPETKVLYMSGYTDNAIVLHGVLVQGVNYIQKPFTVDALTKKVREVLEQ